MIKTSSKIEPIAHNFLVTNHDRMASVIPMGNEWKICFDRGDIITTANFGLAIDVATEYVSSHGYSITDTLIDNVGCFF